MSRHPFYIAVCDDEEPDRRQIEKMTQKVCQEEKIPVQSVCYGNADTLLAAIQKGEHFDLLLLDVIMPKKSGMELARLLRSRGMDTSIVFISNDREMALLGYEVEAARYLGKPLMKEQLKEALTFCYEKLYGEQVLILHCDGGMRRIIPEEIYYIEIAGRKSRIRQANEALDVPLSITQMEQQLAGKGFVRCHKSFLVNCRYIKNFRTSQIELADGRSVPVSKHRVREARKTFFEYLNK